MNYQNTIGYRLENGLRWRTSTPPKTPCPFTTWKLTIVFFCLLILIPSIAYNKVSEAHNMSKNLAAVMNGGIIGDMEERIFINNDPEIFRIDPSFPPVKKDRHPR